MGGTILHVNAVGLMAAIEENRDRSLRSRPFVVAREGAVRSIVLDLSPEAHREGIRRGMMLSLALRRFPGLAVRQPRPELYREADAAMWRIGMSFSPLVERAGQGHLFIDLAGTSRINGPPEDATQKIRMKIMETTGINPSLALASNKTVSKVATRVFRPGGFVALLPHEEGSLVRLQPVELLPGLADLGAFEARAIGPRGPDLVARARGIDDSPVNPEPPERRCLRDSSLCEPDTADPEALRLRLVYLAATLGFAARRENLGARTVRVGIDYSDGRGLSVSSRHSRLVTRDDEIAAAKLDRLQSALDRVHGKHGFIALIPCALLSAGIGLPHASEGGA